MNDIRIIYSILMSLFFIATGICQTPDSATLHGTFVDAENGQPIPDVLVRADTEKLASVYPNREFKHATATTADGAFSLTIPNDRRTYYAFSLMALHPQYQAKRLRYEMSPGKSKYPLGKIALRRTLSLHGKVSGTKNSAGLVVNLRMHTKSADFFRAAAPIENAAKTDTTGKFEFTDLYPIEYTLTSSENNVIIAYVETINPQDQIEISIRSPKIETFRGTVVDTQTHPIAGAQVYATRHAETSHGHSTRLAATQTDSTGNFQIQVLETDPRFLSLEISKRGYLSRIYEHVDIGKMPSMIQLEKGVTIRGRVALPRNLASDAHFTVKVFPADMHTESNLTPLALHTPLLSRSFPVTASAFSLNGLFSEKYTLYVVGDGISATSIDVNASANTQELFIVADQPVTTLQGQILWADTEEPVENAVISRSWYPWELYPSDMSMTLDRFEIETDARGEFKFSNLTEAHYQLHIRAVHVVFDGSRKRYRRTLIHKQVAIPVAGSTYRIYLGEQDGTPFAK